MATKDRILITGALGQIGSSLTKELSGIYGPGQVLATDVQLPAGGTSVPGPFEVLDVLDKKRFQELVDHYQITQIYHLAALLSAKGEQNPLLAWQLNMDGLLNVLELARINKIDKIFWPSSIAVFGEHSPREGTPQLTVMDPTTVYGISKVAGENWCRYYHQKYGVDVRSVRYPGLIGYDALPGGGTTDYAVDIFHKAVRGEPFVSFLSKDTMLPMMYMPDALRSAMELMHADAARLKVRTSYNIAGCSFTPAQLADAIRTQVPSLSVTYRPDHRQAIADSWPDSIDDATARSDWGWRPEYNLRTMTRDMLLHLGQLQEHSAR